MHGSLIFLPDFCSATFKSQVFCNLSQSSALVPKNAESLKAVSAVIDRSRLISQSPYWLVCIVWQRVYWRRILVLSFLPLGFHPVYRAHFVSHNFSPNGSL